MLMTPPASEESSLWKRPFFYSGILLAAAAVYVFLVMFGRYETNRVLEQRNAEQLREQRRAEDRRIIEQLGGSEFSIRALYVSPKVIHRGETAHLCYDVTNAKTVTLDPPEGAVWPSHSRCLDLSPSQTTAYTLTIIDASGKSLAETVQLQVR